MNFLNATASLVFLSTLSVRRATAEGLMSAADKKFLSTLSVRRATLADQGLAAHFIISIHALREESDGRKEKGRHPVRYFYPRSP